MPYTILSITSSFRLISNPFAHLKTCKPEEGMIKNFNGTFGFLALFYYLCNVK